MNRFIQNIISRHASLEHKIKPCVPGMFELDPVSVPEDKVSSTIREQSLAPVHIQANRLGKTSPPAVSQKEDVTPVAPSTSLNDHFPVDIKSAHLDDEHDHELKRVALSSQNMNETQPHAIAQPRDEQQTKNWPHARRFKKGLVTSVGDDLRQLQADHRETVIASTTPPGVAQSAKENTTNEEGLLGNMYPLQQLFTHGKHREDGVFAGTRLGNQTKEAERPVINVTIGRIEIRATHLVAETKASAPRETKISMSLDQYLDQSTGR